MTRFRLLDTPTFRLILLTSLLFGLSACAMFGVMYMAVTGFMEHQLDGELQSEVSALVEGYGREEPDRLVVRVQWRATRHRLPGSYYLLQTDAGEVLAGNLPPQPAPFGGPVDLPPPADDPSLTSEHVLRGYGLHLPNGVNLLAARDTFPQDQVADLMERTFGVGVLATLAAALVTGAIVSRRLRRRMEEIGRTSREIMAGDLTQRIPVGIGDRDFDGLAVGLNEMLSRIEELMDGVRQVTDNIAHDMRTPLTRLRQHLERARGAGHTVEEFRNAVDVALLETDGLLETFGALLRIAQIEARTPGAGLNPIDLSALCVTMAETYGPVAEAEAAELIASIVPGLSIAGDRQLMMQLLVNLIENALQHNGPGTEIRLLLWNEGDSHILAVTDDGVGIPAAERENVLRRFYRIDAARSSQGSGLGLSLVAAIAKYHGAALSLEDNGPGLRALVRFPNSDQ